MATTQATETVELVLEPLHEAQQYIKDTAGRYNTICCGRRFGKDILSMDLLSDPVAEGYPTAWFEPSYPTLTNAWRAVKQLYAPITERVSETEHRIEAYGGGSIDFWTLENPETSGVGRKYKRVIVNEAALTPNLELAWTQTIRPTLTDYQGDAWFPSTPKGRGFYWRLYMRGEDAEFPDWKSFHFPSSANPFLPEGEIELARADMPERMFRQEFLAEFLDDVAGVFRGVYAVVDTGRTETEERLPWQTYSGGVDLARVNDFTVITVLDSSGRQVYFDRWNQISWERQVDAIAQVHERYKCLYWHIDSTGVGDPITERLQRQGLPAFGYHLTNVSKSALIDSLAMSIERGRVSLMDLPVQTNELLAYEYDVTEHGTVRTNAPSGGFDDTVIALALANHGLRIRGFVDNREPKVEKVPMWSQAWLDIQERRQNRRRRIGHGNSPYEA